MLGATLSANPGRYRHRLGTSCGIAGALTSIAIDWWGLRPSVLGRVSGAVAPITPVFGFGLPWHGVVIGTAAGAICVYVDTTVKQIDTYDGSRDAAGGALTPLRASRRRSVRS